MKRLSILLLLLPALCFAKTVGERFPAAVECALQEAGNNRKSLEKLLRYYQKAGNAEKYDAACFLVANMRWHSLGGTVLSYDAAVDSFRRASDAAYYRLIKGTTPEMQETDPLHKALKDSSAISAKRLAAFRFSDPEVSPEELLDIQALDGGFIRRQIEHAFKLRRQVPRVHDMPFRDFCEYILPYRAIADYPLVTGADTLSAFFGKYLQADTAQCMKSLAERYNRALWWLRHYHGQYPFETMLGFPDLFYTGVHECADIAEYAAQIFRACGVPATVEYNVAYRIWDTRHFMVAVPDMTGKWMPFNPEAQIPTTDYSGLRPCLNIFRFHFGAQPDNPYSLAAEKEPLPDDLANPCIEDVSALYLDVTEMSVSLDSTFPPGRHLAYLASFTPGVGLTAVTWGEKDKGRAVFKHVVKDNIYFPVSCRDDGRLLPAGRPFHLISDDTCENGWRIQYFPQPNGERVAVTLRRKYPPQAAPLGASCRHGWHSRVGSGLCKLQ